MKPEEHVNDNPRRALIESLALQAASIAVEVAAFIVPEGPFETPRYVVIGLGGIAALAAGKRWQDYHEMRDQNY